MFLAFVFLGSASAQEPDSSPFGAVKALFASMSAFDYAGMRSIVTGDFQLLEVGEVWDIETLIAAIAPGDGPYERRNYFSLIRVESNDDTAWVSYWNRATFESPDSSSERAWLESAVLIRADGGWKLQLLHSTRVETGGLPDDVEFREHVD